jgi:hypothetical protein
MRALHRESFVPFQGAFWADFPILFGREVVISNQRAGVRELALFCI